MMLWRWLQNQSVHSDPPPIEENDRYYFVEVEAAHALHAIQTALEANPDDRHLEVARNLASDAYLSVRRASARYREQQQARQQQTG